MQARARRCLRDGEMHMIALWRAWVAFSYHACRHIEFPHGNLSL